MCRTSQRVRRKLRKEWRLAKLSGRGSAWTNWATGKEHPPSCWAACGLLRCFRFPAFMSCHPCWGDFGDTAWVISATVSHLSPVCLQTTPIKHWFTKLDFVAIYSDISFLPGVSRHLFRSPQECHTKDTLPQGQVGNCVFYLLCKEEFGTTWIECLGMGYQQAWLTLPSQQ